MDRLQDPSALQDKREDECNKRQTTSGHLVPSFLSVGDLSARCPGAQVPAGMGAPSGLLRLVGKPWNPISWGTSGLLSLFFLWSTDSSTWLAILSLPVSVVPVLLAAASSPISTKTQPTGIPRSSMFERLSPTLLPPWYSTM